MSMRTRSLLLLGALCPLLAVGCGPEVPTVNFAIIMPLTGEAGVYGQDVAAGIQLRHERLLAGDEGLGYNVTIEVLDTESDPSQAAGLLDTAFSSSLAAIGGVTSSEALAMVSVAEDESRVLLSPTASSPELTGVSEYFYRLFPSAEIEASTMATHLRGAAVGVKRLVVVAEDSAFGRSLADAVETTWGTELAGRVVFTPDSDQNAMVREALDYEADGIYVAASGAALAEAIQALRLAGFEGSGKRLATSSSLIIGAVLEAAGPAANGVYLTAPLFEPESPDEPMASFVAAYRELHTDPDAWAAYQGAVTEQERAKTAVDGMDLASQGLAAARSELEAAEEALAASKEALATPSYFAGLGYDAMSVYIAALSELEAINVPSDFLKGMRAVRELPGVTGNIQFRETGDVQKFTRIYEIVNGRPVDFEKYWAGVRKQKQEEMRLLMEQIERANRNQ